MMHVTLHRKFILSCIFTIRHSKLYMLYNTYTTYFMLHVTCYVVYIMNFGYYITYSVSKLLIML